MNLKKILLAPIGLALSTVGCTSTYYMGATSFNYGLSYKMTNVTIGGQTIGQGGGGMATVPIKVGIQDMVWSDAHTGEVHKAKNQIIITKKQLKGKKYIAAHVYQGDIVEITTSNDWPSPTERGEQIIKERNKSQ